MEDAIAMRAIVGCTVDDHTGRHAVLQGEYRRRTPCQAWPTRWANDVSSSVPTPCSSLSEVSSPTPACSTDGQYHPCDAVFVEWYRRSGTGRSGARLAGRHGLRHPAGLREPRLHLPGLQRRRRLPEAGDARATGPQPHLARLSPRLLGLPDPADLSRRENGSSSGSTSLTTAGQGASVANQWLQDQIFRPPPPKAIGSCQVSSQRPEGARHG